MPDLLMFTLAGCARVDRGRIGAELRIAGPALLVAAVAAPVAGTILVIVMAAGGAGHAEMVRMAAVVVEGVCPLGIAIAVVSLVGRDPGLELALTTPVPYRRVFVVRAGLVAGAGALMTFAAAVGFFTAGVWPGEIGAAGLVLIWLAPTVTLTGIGLLVALSTTSAAVGSGVVGGAWLAEALFAGQFAAPPILWFANLFATIEFLPGAGWWASRAGLLVTGIAALAAAGVFLGQRARLVQLLVTEAS